MEFISNFINRFYIFIYIKKKFMKYKITKRGNWNKNRMLNFDTEKIIANYVGNNTTSFIHTVLLEHPIYVYTLLCVGKPHAWSHRSGLLQASVTNRGRYSIHSSLTRFTSFFFLWLHNISSRVHLICFIFSDASFIIYHMLKITYIHPCYGFFNELEIFFVLKI